MMKEHGMTKEDYDRRRLVQDQLEYERDFATLGSIMYAAHHKMSGVASVCEKRMESPPEGSGTTGSATVVWWNRNMPRGTPITYHSIRSGDVLSGTRLCARTRSSAWVESGLGVVLIEGSDGPVPLDRCVPR